MSLVRAKSPATSVAVDDGRNATQHGLINVDETLAVAAAAITAGTLEVVYPAANDPVLTLAQRAPEVAGLWSTLGNSELLHEGLVLIPGGQAASVFLTFATAGLVVGAANSGEFAWYFDPAKHTAPSGKTLKLSIRLIVITNAVAPATTFRGELRSITTVGGASGAYPTITATALVGVAGTDTADIASPGAAAPSAPAYSGDITPPAAGHYVLAVENTGATAAGANCMAFIRISKRYV